MDRGLSFYVHRSVDVTDNSDLPEHIDDVEIHLRYIRKNRDLLLGKVTLSIEETEFGVTNQSWHPVIYTARDGLSVERVGDLDLKYKLEEVVILMGSDYSEVRRVDHICVVHI